MTTASQHHLGTNASSTKATKIMATTTTTIGVNPFETRNIFEIESCSSYNFYYFCCCGNGASISGNKLVFFFLKMFTSFWLRLILIKLLKIRWNLFCCNLRIIITQKLVLVCLCKVPNDRLASRAWIQTSNLSPQSSLAPINKFLWIVWGTYYLLGLCLWTTNRLKSSKTVTLKQPSSLINYAQLDWNRWQPKNSAYWKRDTHHIKPIRA